jgi:hypothetical protein
MEIRKSRTKTSVTIVAATICFSILATIANSNQVTIAQGQPSNQPNPNAPLSFFLKLGNNQSTSAASSQAASNGTGTKNVTITVNVQKGPSGSPMKLPISAVVPKNVNQQDLQLCASLQNGQQKCQPLTQNAPNIDLSSGAAATTTPQAYHDGRSMNNILNVLSSSIIQYADAQLISVNNTTLNIPITVIVPITLEIQNAQICASVASSGSTTCQQIVLNPTQSAFTPVNVDLSNPTTPTVSTLSASIPSTQQLTGGATGSNNTAATGTNNTTASTGTNNTAGTTSGGSGGGTNSTSTQGTSSSGTTTSNQPSSTTQQPTSSEPTQDNTKNKKSNDNKNNGNSDKKNP